MLNILEIVTNGLVALAATGAGAAILYRYTHFFTDRNLLVAFIGTLLVAVGAVAGLLGNIAVPGTGSGLGNSLWHAELAESLGFGVGSILLVHGVVLSVWRKGRYSVSGGEAISVGEARLRDAIESISDGFVLLDADDRVVFFNRRYKQMNKDVEDAIRPGVTYESIIRSGLDRRHIGSAAGEDWAALRMKQHRQGVEAVEERHADGRWVRVDERRTGDGGYVAIRTDISQLKEAERLLSDAIESMSAGFALYDAEERLVTCNQAYRKSLPRINALGLLEPGTTFETLVRATFENDFVPPTYDDGATYMRDRLERFRNPTGPFEFRTSAGRWILIEERKTSDGGTVSIRTDLTERRRTEQALQEQEALLRSIVDNSSSIIVMKDLQGRYSFVNEAYARARGVSAKAMLGKSSYTVNNPDHTDAMRAQDREVMRRREPVTQQRDTTLPDGRPYKRIVTSFPVFGAAGELTGIGTISTDVSELHRAQQALQESETRFRDFAETGADWFWEMDADLRFTYMSENVERIVGVSAAWHIGKTPEDIWDAVEVRSELLEHLETLKAHKAFRNFTYLRNIDGMEPKWLSISGTPVHSDDGAFLGYRGTGTDITALKRMEDLLHSAIDTMSEGFAIFDTDERLIICNDHFQDTLPRIAALGIVKPGVTFGEIVRAGIDNGSVPAGYGDAEAYYTSRLERFRHPTGPYEHISAGDRWYRAEERKTPHGETVAIRTEITEQKRTELALRESEQTLREILERSPIGVAITGRDRNADGTKRKRIFVNDALVSMFRASSHEEMLSSDIADAWVDVERLDAVVAAIAAGENLNDFEALRRRVDGTEWWASMNTRPIRFDNRDCVMIWHFDITERKQIELALRESEERLRRIIDNSPSAIILKDLEGRYRLANKQFAEWCKVTPDEVIGKTPFDIFPEALARNFSNLDDVVLDAGHGYEREVEVRFPTGESRIVAFNKFPVPGPDGKADGIGVIGTDITERKNAELALREREALLRSVIDNMPATISLKDAQGRYLMVNKKFADSTGVGIDAIVGRETHDFRIDEALAKEIVADDRYVLKTGSVLSSEREFTKDSGHYYFSVTKFPVLDAGGTVNAVGTVRIDITERKAMEEQLHQAQKMEAVGQLTGGVAHDFNNMLGVIIGNLDFLEETAGDDPDRRNLIETAQRAAQQGAELTNRLLAFSRKQSLKPDIADLNALIANTTELLKRTLGATVKVRSTAAPDLKLVRIDTGQLETALLNLAVNARHAMPDGGELTIETGNVMFDSHYVETHPEVSPGEYVMLAVSDTGTGMSHSVLERAFEPFFTTKDVGQGSGLGLSMVFGFVKQSGGHTSIYSEPGSGTTVKLYFPASEETAVSEPASARSDEAVSGFGETVLIVEDDEALRNLADRTISSLGYKTLAAPDGRSALDIMEDSARPVDVLFTDIILPGGMNGVKLAEVASAQRPGLRVLYTSGYTENAIIHSGTVDEGIELLNKPYRREELARLLRRVLDVSAD